MTIVSLDLPPELRDAKLTIELVPKTCYFSNLRSELTAKEWDVCKRWASKQAGRRCQLCNGVGARWPVECHEQWEYDEDAGVQRLIGLIALCPRCHRAKHFGHAMNTGYAEEALEQLMLVNGWDHEQVEAYVMWAFWQWERRSEIEWKLDVSWLWENLGVAAEG